MGITAKNELTKKALGIARIEFKFYRAARAQWRIVLDNGEQFSVSTHYFGTESTVLRLAADHLAKAGHGVLYPKRA